MFVVGLVELGKEFALSTLVATFYYPFCAGAGYPPGGGYGLYG